MYVISTGTRVRGPPPRRAREGFVMTQKIDIFRFVFSVVTGPTCRIPSASGQMCQFWFMFYVCETKMQYQRFL
jgi:hypothetical protein